MNYYIVLYERLQLGGGEWLSKFFYGLRRMLRVLGIKIYVTYVYRRVND